MATESVAIHIVLPALVGIVIGVIEAYFVYEDENMTSGRQFIGDMWHGLLFAVAGVIIASNVPWLIVNYGQFIEGTFVQPLLMVDFETGKSMAVSILITLIMMVKMVGSHAIKGVSGSGFREKMWHKVVIAALVGFAPYYIIPLYSAEFLINLHDMIPWLPF